MFIKRNIVFLIAGTISIILIVLSLIQIYWSDKIIINQALNRVNQDINSFHAFLNERKDKIETIAVLLSKNEQMVNKLSSDKSNNNSLFDDIKKQFDFDFLSFAQVNNDSSQRKTNLIENFLIKNYMKIDSNLVVSGITLLPSNLVSQMGEQFRSKCSINNECMDALILFSIVPLYDFNVGINKFIIVAELLNNSNEFLDEIHNAIFKDEFYNGKRIGTITIFAKTTRIATTVLLKDNKRATGTKVSSEVENQVLKNGIPWNGRALVVDTWYISQYDPLYDPSEKIIGMLYIGQLEKFFVDKKYEIILTSLGAVIFILILAIVFAFFLLQQSKKYENEKRKIRFDFIQLLAHELKSPLNAVESYLQLLTMNSSKKLAISQEQIAKKSINRIDHMRKLIMDLLDLTRIESGEMKREIKTVDIKTILNRSIELHHQIAKQKNITISHRTEGNCLTKVVSGEIEIILNNLLSNGIKYNVENGKVDVILKCSENELEIVVRDTGIGMSKDESQKVFNEFVRIKNSKTQGIHGSGLGLSIVKKIASLYKGSVDLSSTPNSGSTFTVLLKL